MVVSIFTIQVMCALAVELWRNLSVKTKVSYLPCLVLVLCCCVAKSHSALGLAWKTRHLRLVLRRREEGCGHDGGIDAIINITDRLPPPPLPPPLRKPLATFIIIIIEGDVSSICSQPESSTHTLTVVGTRSRFALLRGKLPQLQSQFRASTCFFHQPRVDRSLTNNITTTTTNTEVACTRTSHHHHAFLLHPQHSARASIPLALQIHRHPAARMRFRP